MTETASRGGLLLRHLPEIYHDSELVRGILGHHDEVLAALVERIETSHLDYGPMASAHFLDWVGGWLGLEPNASLDDRRRRAMLTSAPELNRKRGTKEGLSAQLAAGLGLNPDAIKIHTPEADPNKIVVAVMINPEAGDAGAKERIRIMALQASRFIEEHRPAHVICELTIQTKTVAGGGGVQP